MSSSPTPSLDPQILNWNFPAQNGPEKRQQVTLTETAIAYYAATDKIDMTA